MIFLHSKLVWFLKFKRKHNNYKQYNQMSHADLNITIMKYTQIYNL